MQSLAALCPLHMSPPWGRQFSGRVSEGEGNAQKGGRAAERAASFPDQGLRDLGQLACSVVVFNVPILVGVLGISSLELTGVSVVTSTGRVLFIAFCSWYALSHLRVLFQR